MYFLCLCTPSLKPQTAEYLLPFYTAALVALSQRHLHDGVHSRFSFAHLQREQGRVQAHLISSLHTLATWEMDIHIGFHEPFTLTQENSVGDGISGTGLCRGAPNTSLIYCPFDVLQECILKIKIIIGYIFFCGTKG